MRDPDLAFLVDLAGALPTGQLVTDKDVIAAFQGDQASWLTPDRPLQ